MGGGEIIRLFGHRADRPGNHRVPGGHLIQPGEVGPDCQPFALADTGRQAAGHIGQIHMVDAARRQAGQFGRIEPRRGPAKVGQGKARQQIGQARHRFHRLRRTQPGQQRGHRHRLDALFAPAFDAFRPQPLRQCRILAGEQRHMRQPWRRSAQGGKHLQLHSAVGDMILAAGDIGDAQIDIVHHRWQHIEPRPIGAAHHRIGQRARREMAGPAHAVVPFHIGAFIHAEAPVRLAAFGFQPGLVRIAQRQRGAVINRRQPA